MTKTVQYQNELHKFLIWDTAGQERVSRVLQISLIAYLSSDLWWWFWLEFEMLFNPTPESCKVIWFYELLLEY